MVVVVFQFPISGFSDLYVRLCLAVLSSIIMWEICDSSDVTFKSHLGRVGDLCPRIQLQLSVAAEEKKQFSN